jgi:hypothetical protein
VAGFTLAKIGFFLIGLVLVFMAGLSGGLSMGIGMRRIMGADYLRRVFVVLMRTAFAVVVSAGAITIVFGIVGMLVMHHRAR